MALPQPLRGVMAGRGAWATRAKPLLIVNAAPALSIELLEHELLIWRAQRETGAAADEGTWSPPASATTWYVAPAERPARGLVPRHPCLIIQVGEK